MTEVSIDGTTETGSRTVLSLEPLGRNAGEATASVSQSTQPLRALRFEFTGSGSEYFRIWVVNLLLTILTLGVYSAWAKVRRLQYFYRNTRVGDAIFDYHGSSKAILKGRALALVLLLAYNISYEISTPVAVAVLLILAAIMPWLIARAFHFKLANSSYRGLHFRFRGTVGEAYRMLILFPIVLAITALFVWSLVTSFARSPGLGVILLSVFLTVAALATTVPLAHYFLKRFQYDHAYFGQTPFYFHARPSDFFKTYGKAVGFFFLGAIPSMIFAYLTEGIYQSLEASMFGWLFALLYGLGSIYTFYLFVWAYLQSRVQNLVWNQAELGVHRFQSTASARRLLWIHASNLALIALTLGLYKPFAAVRLAKYRIESVTLLAEGGVEDFHANRDEDAAGATGQEVNELFNFDIAL